MSRRRLVIAIGRIHSRTGLEPRGQSSLEWIGLVLLVSALFTGLAFGVRGVPAVGLVHSISTRLLCAASLSGDCDRPEPLVEAYGGDLAALVRRGTPELLFGRDLLGLPVDFRSCRSAYCAEGPGKGRVTESLAGEPVTLFTRVLDCRGSGDRTGPDPPPGGCDGGRAGSVYVQFWAYYPESASLRGAQVLEQKGYHHHDWESVQIRVGPDGEISQRASSHAGYNHTRSVTNWGSDLGWGVLREAAEKAGLRRRGGWGEQTGRYLIAGGSHAGNVDGRVDSRSYPSYTPAGRIRLVPLEATRFGPLARSARFDPITPPWEKEVWRDPEAEGTG